MPLLVLLCQSNDELANIVFLKKLQATCKKWEKQNNQKNKVDSDLDHLRKQDELFLWLFSSLDLT